MLKNNYAEFNENTKKNPTYFQKKLAVHVGQLQTHIDLIFVFLYLQYRPLVPSSDTSELLMTLLPSLALANQLLPIQ